MERKRLPYGIPNFRSISEEGYVFVDKTQFVETLEELGEKYIFFLRPRKFGKSLFISMLQHYYDVKHADKFERLFGDFYIGEYPTPLHNSYLVLIFDFSGINRKPKASVSEANTGTNETTLKGFLEKVKSGVRRFMGNYADLLGEFEWREVLEVASPEIAMGHFLDIVGQKTDRKIYLLVDEYDHFANELLAFRIDMFKELVSRTGFVRKFYEVLKTGARDGVIDRMFITGVTPITLDSLTSGFNIGTNLSLEENSHNMLGFTEKETYGLIEKSCSESDCVPDEVYRQMTNYYNGYKFSKRIQNGKLFNPDMVLYYLRSYMRYCRPPDEIIDINIASDYKKIGNLINPWVECEAYRNLLETEKGREIVSELMEQGSIFGNLTLQFNLEREFERDAFLSLLLYMGYITVESGVGEECKFQIPNYVIDELYYRFLYELLEQEYALDLRVSDLRAAMRQIAYEGKMEKLVGIVEYFLRKVLSNRDLRGFRESHYSWEGAWGRVGERSNTNNMERLNRPEKPPPKPSPNILKVHILTLLHLSRLFYIQSEMEAERGYIDIFLRETPQFQVDYEWVLELKYVRQEETRDLRKLTEEGMEQLRRYMEKVHLQAQRDLRGVLLIFSGRGECVSCNVV